ncbi:hypothetical protein [Vibrio parahaemolyticus]|uniref:hypothetical protein n=2 Tax=Vibrio parahaemolyticus TaxID=670 RepID=UPI00046FCFCE|nr:hypothetical protein [Vibrio parahaemolyticus]
MCGITELIGSKLSRVEGVGLSSLKFSSGRLVVYNPITLSGCDGMKSLVFREVLDLKVAEDSLLLVFSGQASLRVSLLDNDFTGPEAAVYTSNSGFIVVFN